ncbi:MAG: metallophosphatase, partial [Bacteroidota bacterium]|nr:metallophosphatase [Bacteroidota bacterium]
MSISVLERPFVRLCAIGVLLAAVFTVPFVASAQSKDTGLVALTILHYNDFHSQNLPFSVTKSGTGEAKQTIQVGGAAALKAYADRYRHEKPNTLLLHAGDDFQGTPVCSITRGRSQCEILELIQPDAMTLGNHEFDYGREWLKTLLPLVTFPIVSANLFDSANGVPFVPRYRVIQRGGLTIGVIGLAPVDLHRLTLRENVRGIQVLETDTAVRRAMEDVRRHFGADVIIVLSHMGIEEDTALARRVPGIDLIVGGHSHTALFRPIRIGGTTVVQA